MRRLLLFLVLLLVANDWVLAQTTPTPEAGIHLDIVVEFENIQAGQYQQWFEGLGGFNTCVNDVGIIPSEDLYSSNFRYVYYPASGFTCVFTFYGAGFGLRSNSTSDRRDITVDIDGEEVFYISHGDGTTYRYVDLELGVHYVEINPQGTHGTYTPRFDYMLFRTYAYDLQAGPEGTQEVIEVTPDGATVYSTVVFDEMSQTVALRYQVDAGQVMIVILLAAILATLVVMYIAQLRRRAPEP